MSEPESANIYTKNEQALADYTKSSFTSYTPGNMVSEGSWTVDYVFQPKYSSRLSDFDSSPAPSSCMPVFNKEIKVTARDGSALTDSLVSNLEFSSFNSKWYIQSNTNGVLTILIDTTPMRGMERAKDVWPGTNFIVLRELEARDGEERTDPSEGTVTLHYTAELMRDDKPQEGGHLVFGEEAFYRGRGQ